MRRTAKLAVDEQTRLDEGTNLPHLIVCIEAGDLPTSCVRCERSRGYWGSPIVQTFK
jgi:hypothetical protein